jgi:hypothetical protein
MPLTHDFRFIKRTWGISIKLTARAESLGEDSACLQKISNNLSKCRLSYSLLPTESPKRAEAGGLCGDVK